MLAEYFNQLRKMRGSILGWTIGLAAYCLLMASMYGSIVDLGDEMQQLLESYPPEFMAFFPGIENFASPIGFIDTYFNSMMHFIIGIFAAGAAARLLVREEEEGTLDLVMSYPISRSKLFWARFMAYGTSLVLILLGCWIGWAIPAKQVDLPLSYYELFLPMLPLFAVLVLFGGMALLLSLILPASRLAGGLSAGMLVGNFLLVGLSELNVNLQPIFENTPLYFYQGAKIINDPNWNWIAGLVGVALIMAIAAWLIFLRRDIRVGGEAGWRIPVFIQKSGTRTKTHN